MKNSTWIRSASTCTLAEAASRGEAEGQAASRDALAAQGGHRVILGKAFLKSVHKAEEVVNYRVLSTETGGGAVTSKGLAGAWG